MTFFNERMLANMSFEEKANYELPIEAAEAVDEQDRFDEGYNDAWREGHSSALHDVICFIEDLDKKLDRDNLISMIRKEV